MLKYFGTDGFRGKANQDLTVEHAYKIGRFLGFYYGPRSRIVIGKDTRRSCYMYECALTAGITASGADVYLMHVTTTPSVSYIARVDGFNCGIMISASHNPYDDNGIKLLNDQGEKMDDSFLEEVEQYLDGDITGLVDGRENASSSLKNNGDAVTDIPFATGEQIGRAMDYASGRNRYIGYLISLATHSYKGIRIGLDCANGSAWMIAKSVFEAIGANTFVINNSPSGLNINDHCGSTHIAELQNLVKEKKLDVGFAFDGDADRCIAVDERGDIIDGDSILYLYGRYMQDRGKLDQNTVVVTVMSNFGFFKAMEQCGIHCEITAVGDRFVYERMREKGYLIGGEQSGHVIFSKYANTGDGILTAIKIMQAMLSSKMPLSALIEGFTRYPQVLKNLKVKDKDEVLNDKRVQDACNSIMQSLGENGRILLRKSGTEPVLRIMVEASTMEICTEKVDEIVAIIDHCGYLMP